MSKSLWLILISLALSGCTSVPPDAGFDDVRRLATRQSGYDVRWNNSTSDDQAADASVQSMLGHELTMQQAVQIALLNNRNLQATYEELGIAQADLVQAGLLRNPVFDLSLRFPHAGGKSNLEVGVAEDFLSILYLPLHKKIAAAEFEAAKLRIADRVLQLAADARSTFYTLQADAQLVELRQGIADTMAASADTARRLRDAGNISELELAIQQATSEETKIDLAAAKSQMAVDRERLHSLMGLSGQSASWSVAPRLPELPGSEPSSGRFEAQAVAQRLDLASARQKVIAAGRTTFADLQIGIDTERDPDGKWVTGPTFSGPIPLFDQGQAAFAKARAQLRQARRHYAAMVIDIGSEVRTAAGKMYAARARVEEYAKAILPLRRQIVEQTQLHYNAMQLGVFQLLEAKKSEIDAGRAYVEALRDYWIARSDLERAVGGQPNDEELKVESKHE